MKGEGVRIDGPERVASSRFAPWRAGRKPGSPSPVLDAPVGLDYEEVFRQALIQLDHRMRGFVAEQVEAGRLYRRVMRSRSPFHQRWLLRDLASDRSLCLVVLLVDEAHQRAEAPRDALEHATLAARIASRLSRQHYGDCLVEEISARVWACVGSACRRVGRLECAGKAFRRARGHLSKGCGEPLEEGLVLEQEAALDATRGRWLEAAFGLERAAASFRQVCDGHLLGRVQIKQGVLEVLRGGQRAAREHLISGLAELEGERDPHAAALGQVLLAVLLSADRALPMQAQARKSLRQARRWLDRPQARAVRRLMGPVEAQVLRAPTSVAGKSTHLRDTQRLLERLLPVWPRCL